MVLRVPLPACAPLSLVVGKIHPNGARDEAKERARENHGLLTGASGGDLADALETPEGAQVSAVHDQRRGIAAGAADRCRPD